jgi:hypothetical protein
MFDLHENRFLAAGALHHNKDSIESLINITSRGKPLSSSTVMIQQIVSLDLSLLVDEVFGCLM